jgi:hypothetical protein
MAYTRFQHTTMCGEKLLGRTFIQLRTQTYFFLTCFSSNCNTLKFKYLELKKECEKCMRKPTDYKDACLASVAIPFVLTEVSI